MRKMKIAALAVGAILRPYSGAQPYSALRRVQVGAEAAGPS